MDRQDSNTSLDSGQNLTTYGNARQASIGSILSLRSPQQRHDSAQYSAYSQSNDHNSSIASQENSRYFGQGGSQLRRSGASGRSGQYADDRHYRGGERSASNATNDFFEGDGNFNHNFDNKFFEGTSQCSDRPNESSEFLRSNDQASPRQDRRRRQSGTSVGSAITDRYSEEQRIAAQWQT